MAVEEPKRTETNESHPSYGMVGASRVTGTINLFGSDFTHHHFVSITIQEAEMHRSVSRDWPFAKNELIRISLSEAQWAAFVASMNVGDGVCCTIERVDGKQRPDLPPPQSRTAQFRAEFNESLGEIFSLLSELKKNVSSQRLKHDVDVIEKKLAGNVPFVAKSFTEHMEDTLTKAKIEVTAYVQSILARTGIKALKGRAPFELPEGRDDERS